jgi:hypothetical protein
VNTVEPNDVNYENDSLRKIVARVRFFNIVQKDKIQAIVALHLDCSTLEAFSNNFDLGASGKLFYVPRSEFLAFKPLNCKSGNIL